MTLITFQDGKPVLRDGKVGTGQGCCCGPSGPNCVYACYCHPGDGGEGWVIQDAPCVPTGNCCTSGPSRGCELVIVATATINKPLVLAGSSVLVTVSGTSDDDIAIDGDFVGPSCRDPNTGPIAHAFFMDPNDSAFDLGAVDNYGVCATAQLTVCFSDCSVFAQPTLTISGSGSGAVFTLTLSQVHTNSLWVLTSVAASGGMGYVDGESLTITASAGDTEVIAAAATLFVGKAAPELSLPGNATGTVSTQLMGDGTYAVSAVTVTYGGSGYTDGELLIFDKAADDVTVFNATAIARVAYTEPQNATVAVYSANGSGAVFSLAWQLMPTPPQLRPNIRVYRPIITITNGGTGYADYDQIFISFPSPDDGGVQEYVYIDADIVGPSGEIQQIYMEPPDGGLYYGAGTDALDSVELGQGGSYFKDDPDARTVLITSRGAYYRCEENPFP